MKVIKIGGKLIEDERALISLCTGLASASPCVIVHGGGSMAGSLSSRLGVEVKMYGGKRITDKDTLDITVMAYAGLANKKITATLQAKGVNACGLSGCDMGIVVAHKREIKEIDWGFVGDIDRVDTESLTYLLDKGVVPVISPVTFDLCGQLLNTNADSVASAVASSLVKHMDVELVFCFDKPGVLADVNDPGSVIPAINKNQYKEYVTRGLIHSGMLPKLENAFKAISSGVKSVRLTDYGHLEGGTVIMA